MSESGDKTDGAPVLRGLEEAEKASRTRSLPPVHLWNPPFQGEIDMRIRRDGVWEYLGTPINRPAMVRLFSTILRREPDGRYVLVTPVEMVGITVEDAPFIAVELAVRGEGPSQDLVFRTNVDDIVTAGEGHAIRLVYDPKTGDPRPYLHVRAGLEALIARPVYYELAELASEHDMGGVPHVGVWSGGVFFPFVSAEDLSP